MVHGDTLRLPRRTRREGEEQRRRAVERHHRWHGSGRCRGFEFAERVGRQHDGGSRIGDHRGAPSLRVRRVERQVAAAGEHGAEHGDRHVDRSVELDPDGDTPAPRPGWTAQRRPGELDGPTRRR